MLNGEDHDLSPLFNLGCVSGKSLPAHTSAARLAVCVSIYRNSLAC